MSSPAGPAPAATIAATQPRERVFTLPLTAFLLGVVAVIAYGLYQRHRVPAVDDAIVMLADGDLDGKDRKRMLRVTIDAAMRSDDPAHHWAGMLAAIALDDRQAHGVLRGRVGGEAKPPPPPEGRLREFLHLGDPMLRNVLLALGAEAAGDRPEARKRWRQVAAQCYFMVRPLAGELAEAGIQRSS
jgi:hypothetical protein